MAMGLLRHVETKANNVMKTKTQSAFTLLEIMMVVAIIDMLATIAIPNISHAVKEARERACNLNRKNIDAAKLHWSLARNESHDARRVAIWTAAGSGAPRRFRPCEPDELFECACSARKRCCRSPYSRQPPSRPFLITLQISVIRKRN